MWNPHTSKATGESIIYNIERERETRFGLSSLVTSYAILYNVLYVLMAAVQCDDIWIVTIHIFSW